KLEERQQEAARLLAAEVVARQEPNQRRPRDDRQPARRDVARRWSRRCGRFRPGRAARQGSLPLRAAADAVFCARSIANAYWKCSGRRLPGTRRPLMKNVGVDSTPTLAPIATSAATLAAAAG